MLPSISKEIGDRRNEGGALSSIGNVYLDLGQVLTLNLAPKTLT